MHHIRLENKDKVLQLQQPTLNILTQNNNIIMTWENQSYMKEEIRDVIDVHRPVGLVIVLVIEVENIVIMWSTMFKYPCNGFIKKSMFPTFKRMFKWSSYVIF